MKGYKATDKDMKCRGYQFTMNEWHEHTGDLKMCENGFHFCVYPSGVWSFYNDEGTRVFEIEAEDLLDTPIEAGAEVKKVCRRIRFVKEIFPDGDRNTGDRNTGDRNTGNRNTGDRNTGNWNTGNWNTGYINTGNWNTGNRNTGNRNTGNRNTGDRNTGNWNTGDSNTGYSNTGNWNTGDSNTGNRNTGNSNTGDSNTGDRNTGDSNTGNSNTGYRNTGDSNTGNSNTGNSNTGNGNCCDRSSGHFNTVTPPLIMFDLPTDQEPDSSLVYLLSCKLSEDEEFDCRPYLSLPNATEEKIKALHKKHIEKRKSEVKG